MYHAYLPENHAHFVPEEQVMQEGIQSFTESNNRYSNGGRVKIEKTESLRPVNTPNWVNFKEAIGVDISNRFFKSYCFPVFTDKIRVFDADISISIYDQAFYDDFNAFDEEALNFDTGKSIEYWIKLYWDSMMTLQEYFLKRPYPKPEILVFESIPKEIIRVCEKNHDNMD
ncbi:hypothetical protein E6C60_0949 [Paenibacillus algicola]|uniref:DNA polymerase III n=1 Tax=Paenibacillus algicola TaxID=2565926 RepID=A0A4P8XH82_9BACL|nr:hypothetical protein E6C60_0949 [Paenibacillus algicola]